MKNLILNFGLFSAFVFIFSCSKKDENTTEISDPNATKTIIDQLDCLGFGHKKVEILGENTVLVDDDIILEKDMILNPEKYAIHSPGHVEDRQYTAGTGLIAPANVNINYWIDPAVPATWVTAINTATADWTSITNCSITFTLVSTPPGAGGLIFTTHNTTNATALASAPAACFTFPSTTFARGRYPAGGFVGRAVIINLASSTTPNASGRLTIMRHEIGHTLGFRHSDSSTNGEGNTACGGTTIGAPTLIPCTPTNDGTSIMFSTTSGTTLTAINYNDAWSAKLTYTEGLPSGGVSFQSYNYNTGKITISTGSNYCPRIRVVRNSNGVTKYDGCPGGTFWEMDTGTSPYTYTVTLFNAAGTAVSTTTQSVYWF